MDISTAFDEVGGEFNDYTAREYTCYHARVVDEDLPMALDVLGDMLTSSHVAGEDVTADACLAKKTAVDTAEHVCHEAVQIFGGAGYLHGSEVERHYRDARILGIGGGATEVLTDLSARLLGYTP